MDVSLLFAAGRLAERRGWSSAEAVDPGALASIAPGAGEVIVVAPEGTFSVQHARDVAALNASGKSVAVVTPAPLAEDVRAWLPADCLHVLTQFGSPNLRDSSGAPGVEGDRTDLIHGILRRFANDPDPQVRRIVVMSEEAPADLWRQFAEDDDEFIRLCAARSEHTPVDALERFTYGDSYARLAVARNRKWPIADAQNLMRQVAAECGDRLERDDDDDDSAYETLREIAEDPRCPGDLLRTLAAEYGPYVQASVGCNPSAPLDLLLQLGREGVEEETMRMVETYPPEALRILASDPQSWVRFNVANSPNTPADVLRGLSSGGTSSIRYQVAYNPSTPIDVLQALAKDTDTRVRAGVASNPSASIDLLQALCRDPENWVRASVASNPTASTDMLRALATDCDEGVRGSVAKNPKVPADLYAQLVPLLVGGDDWDARCEVASNPATPLDILIGLSRDEERSVVGGVARNPSAPAEVLARLATAEDSWLRLLVAANPTTPIDLLGRLAHDADADVRRAVAGNPQAPLEVLRSLAVDTTGAVRWAVAKNPATPIALLEDMANGTV